MFFWVFDLNNSDRFLAVLDEAKGPLCDDCASVISSIYPRQQINQIANRLADRGEISRGRDVQCCNCQSPKKSSWIDKTIAFLKDNSAQPLIYKTVEEQESKTLEIDCQSDLTRAWDWEGNVQAVLCTKLKNFGWEIKRAANTKNKEPGVDVVATRGQQKLLIEVKGFPSKTYEAGSKKGELKPTQPTSQARQWYSHALLSAMRMLDKNNNSFIGLCFPECKTYRNLVGQTGLSLRKLGVGVLFISSSGVLITDLPMANGDLVLSI